MKRLTPAQANAIIAAIQANQTAPEGQRKPLRAIWMAHGITSTAMYKLWRRRFGGDSPAAFMRRPKSSGTMKVTRNEYRVGATIPVSALRQASMYKAKELSFTVPGPGQILITAKI